MTKEEILTIADQAGIIPWKKLEWVGQHAKLSESDEGLDGDLACLLQFANLIAATEREACAKLCEEEIARIKPYYSVTAENCVKLIRSRT
jgi:hypothetical protein